ncbi:hypothetical protein DXG03_008894 [Asterophora parasitica]|uniref:Uncharacterized protein n=1 Tax=Asterophora parasitica TaxID=117018 RepID=A0A9P7GCW4_9AGAR|nr:hypothetical protein DXG03_008894 [Asterophora parasitica]
MPTTLAIPDGFQWVGASILSTVFVLAGQNAAVSKWRKRAGIKYPQMYAEKAEAENSKDALIFNCAQRAHQNTLENIPIVYVTTLLTGLKYPLFAASACTLWSVARISYTRGYLTGDPSKRSGGLYVLGTLGTIGKSWRRSQGLMFTDEPESDRERMLTDSSAANSETSTPPMKVLEKPDELKEKAASSRPPLTPPRRRSSASMDVQDSFSPLPGRRPSFPIKPPRILNLLAESRPEENEVKSEAAFQRLITSCSDLPIPPRTPRVTADRGRYPEEAGREEFQREDTPSDDEEQVVDIPSAFSSLGGSEPIAIKKPPTPAGSLNGDDLSMMSTSESSSFGAAAMDVDLAPASPFSVMSTPINHWRYTPPPTISAVRSNKRKLDDRFDPYPSSSKRRAVSPSMSHLRDYPGVGVGSPMNGRNARLPIAIPVNIPSAVSSATSSPTISSSFPSSLSRPVSMTSSPTLRSSMILASPILRPVPRYMSRRGEEDEREIQGAGEAVGGLTLD